MIKTVIKDWAFKQNEKCWQSLNTCRQAKEMIKGGCLRRERDLLALPRQILRLVVGILTGYVPVQRHLSLMGLSNNPFCSYCDEAIESALHFLCYCSYFSVLRTAIWGNQVYTPMILTVLQLGTLWDPLENHKGSHKSQFHYIGDGWWADFSA